MFRNTLILAAIALVGAVSAANAATHPSVAEHAATRGATVGTYAVGAIPKASPSAQVKVLKHLHFKGIVKVPSKNGTPAFLSKFAVVQGQKKGAAQ